MEFIEKQRIHLGKKKYQMFKLLNLESPQAYISLIKSKDRITLKNLIRLRKHLGLSDTQLLDLIEEEVSRDKNE